jgi:hypothetical protein
MSAFPDSGRSHHSKMVKMKGRFRPGADIESADYEEGSILEGANDDYPYRREDFMVPLIPRNNCHSGCAYECYLDDQVFHAQTEKMIDTFHKRIDEIQKVNCNE